MCLPASANGAAEALDLNVLASVTEGGVNRRRRILGLDVANERHARVMCAQPRRDALPVRVRLEVRDDHVRALGERAVATAENGARVVDLRPGARGDGVAGVVQRTRRGDTQA
jgi:hypothetical protein